MTPYEEVAKLTRISILNWAKENEVELKVDTDNDDDVGVVTTIVFDDVVIFYFYNDKKYLVMDSQNPVELESLKPGTKISDKLIELISTYT